MKKLFFVFAISGLLVGTSASLKAQYDTLHNFNGVNGKYPFGSLLLLGNRLYGMTSNGGANKDGNIFSIDTNGSGYKDMFDFNGTNGSSPFGSLTISKNKFYGVASLGGANNDGCIFSIDTNGTGYTDMYDFTGTTNYYPYASYSSLILSGDTLFGIKPDGGTQSAGCIFSIDTDGTGYANLLNFSGTNGAFPQGSLTLFGGVLYGMTEYGGTDDAGCIFSINTNGSGYKDLLNFNALNGSVPIGSLTFSGNKMYGMTSNGAPEDVGLIFSVNTDGTGYKDLIDFNYLNGSLPQGSLTLSGGTLYGMTREQGQISNEGNGTIFMIDTNGSNFFTLFNFDGSNGSAPYGNLMLSGNTLYGMASSGGVDTDGVVFKYKLNCNNYNEPICMVTVDTATNKSKVIWGRTDSPPDTANSSYNIYRESSSAYLLAHNQHLNNLSEYIDTSSNPLAGPTSYKISTVDSCGESQLSLPHTTSYLTVTAGVNVFHLSWTPYIGFLQYANSRSHGSRYVILRGLSKSTLVPIDTIGGSDSLYYHGYTYTDTLAPAGSFYAIEAIDPWGVCVPSTHGPHQHLSATPSGSFSNVVSTRTLGIESIGSTLNNLKVYPNPSNGIFTLKYSISESDNMQISIINELGQIVYQEEKQSISGVNTEQLNLGNVASGIYSLRMQTNSSITIRKLVIIGR